MKFLQDSWKLNLLKRIYYKLVHIKNEFHTICVSLWNITVWNITVLASNVQKIIDLIGHNYIWNNNILQYDDCV